MHDETLHNLADAGKLSSRVFSSQLTLDVLLSTNYNGITLLHKIIHRGTEFGIIPISTWSQLKLEGHLDKHIEWKDIPDRLLKTISEYPYDYFDL